MLPRLTLYQSPTSPFARRVRAALRRLSIAHEEVHVENLFPPPASFLKINPLGLIPALALQGKDPIVDSSVILDFLDDHAGGVWPKELEERWAVKRVSTLATGIMADAVAWRLESVRTDPRAEILASREAAIHATLNPMVDLRARKPQWWRKPNQALFDLAISLEYLAFRLGHVDWMEGVAPLYDDLLDAVEEFPAFVDTAPPGFLRT